MPWFDLFLIKPLAILIRNLRQPYHIAHVEVKPGQLWLDPSGRVPSKGSPEKVQKTGLCVCIVYSIPVSSRNKIKTKAC